MPGRSFAAILRGERLNWDYDEVVICDEYGPNRMLRTTDWKYVHRYPDGPNELYCLMQDPGEKENLVDEPDCKAVRDSMRARLDKWFEKYVCAERDGVELYDCQGGGQLDRVDTKAADGPLFKTRA